MVSSIMCTKDLRILNILQAILQTYQSQRSHMAGLSSPDLKTDCV